MDKRRKILKKLNFILYNACMYTLSVLFPSIHIQSLIVIDFSDVSFNNNTDESTKIGYITLIVNKFNNVISIYFLS